MRLFRRAAGTPSQPVATDEDPVVRQYRYLLRTVPPDTLEHMHLEALTEVAGEDRAAVLRTVQEQLVTGLHLQPDEVPALARLVVLGERRSPGALLRHCRPDVLRRLADAALASEAAFGLLTGLPRGTDRTRRRQRKRRGRRASTAPGATRRRSRTCSGPTAAATARGTPAEVSARRVVTAAVEPPGASSTRDAGVRLHRDQATTTALLHPV